MILPSSYIVLENPCNHVVGPTFGPITFEWIDPDSAGYYLHCLTSVNHVRTKTLLKEKAKIPFKSGHYLNSYLS